MIAISLFCFGCSHTHTHDFWDLTFEKKQLSGHDNAELLRILLEANRKYWIKAAIWDGATVSEALKRSDIIYSALTPNPYDEVISEFTTETYEYWEKFKEEVDRKKAEQERERKRRRQERKNKQ